MKAVIYKIYGPPGVLQLTEVPKPTPKPNEVLVKVHATTVTIGDVIMRSFKLPIPWWQAIFARLYLGVRQPKRQILGMELAGEIETVGNQVTKFKPGDQVFASTFSVNFGGYAEYKCFPETGMLASKPVTLSYGEAAALPGGGMTALRCLHKAQIQPGQRVLIYGASGAVGTDAVQLARHFGATVTGVCGPTNLALVKSLGADQVLDYTQEAFAHHNETYDVVFDAVGKLAPARAQTLRKRGGIHLNVHKDSDGGEKLEDLRLIGELAAAGHLRPVIDRSYPLAQIVKAHQYVEQGHKKGNVIIHVIPTSV